MPSTPTTLAQEHRLLVPIATTAQECQSAHEAWCTIYARLGERVWEYLPRRTRRWRHNGKQYVTHGLRVLHEYGLIRQHIIRYDALHEHLQEVILLVHPETLAELRTVAPIIETYHAETLVLARVFGDTHLIKMIFRHEGILACWMVNEHKPIQSKFRYDLLEIA